MSVLMRLTAGEGWSMQGQGAGGILFTVWDIPAEHTGGALPSIRVGHMRVARLSRLAEPVYRLV